jgi:hypothetical protein
LDAAQSYLASSNEFTPSEFAETISDFLLSTPKTEKNGIDHLLNDIKERAQLDRMIYDPTDVPRTEFVRRWLRLLHSNPKLLIGKPQATYFGLRRILPGELGDIR